MVSHPASHREAPSRFRQPATVARLPASGRCAYGREGQLHPTRMCGGISATTLRHGGWHGLSKRVKWRRDPIATPGEVNIIGHETIWRRFSGGQPNGIAGRNERSPRRWRNDREGMAPRGRHQHPWAGVAGGCCGGQSYDTYRHHWATGQSRRHTATYCGLDPGCCRNPVRPRRRASVGGHISASGKPLMHATTPP
jgi:hypothetical protein